MQNYNNMLAVGTTLQQRRYTIQHVLGQGGFGITYEGVQKGLNRKVAIGLTIQTAQALEMLHHHQTMHLDVKPSNILLRKDAQGRDDVVLIDFGVSKHYDREGYQTTSTPVGLSKGFAPFEQYREGGVREFSPATDAYSLGATLYYLVTSQAPPEAAELVESPLARPDGVSVPLWQVISSAMSFRRSDRYQSMADLIQALHKLPVAAEPSVQKPVTPMPEPKPKAQKPAPVEPNPVDTKATAHSPASQETKPVGSTKTVLVKPQKKSKWSWITAIACVLLLIAVVAYLGSRQNDCLLTLEGHTNSVFSAAFSPDGKRIVSASADNTIRIWDAQTGKQIGDPLKGHTEGVWSASFSPDGKRIVSASSDNTIRIWDAQTGKQMGNPLEGHTHPVRSAVFSPDGKRIVSASADKTIRIWDAQTGRQIGAPLQGHTSYVFSAAFSPDGQRIVSASDDKTICIWDAQTGRQIGNPLEGHTDVVCSAAFSPDGKRIVSASWDKTIRIWDAQTGEQIGHPLKEHTDIVEAAAFSPDGKRIVSTSWDNTIRIWDAQTGEQIDESLEEHTGFVYSASFSPDGKRIVSASADKTIRIWDVSGY